MQNINESYESKYLVCVTTNNNNKFYRMIVDPDQSGFTVEYGRIGATSFQTRHYSIDDYWKKYDEKLKKGYVDQTDLVKNVVTTAAGDDGFKAIEDKSVNELVKALRKYANETIKQNYTISQNAVTQEMLDKAKELIDKLNEYANDTNKSSSWKNNFNDYLLRLFKTIPRKMNRVNEYLLQSTSDKDVADVLDREQKLYDVLLVNFQTVQAKTDATANNTTDASNAPTETILEKFGLECQLVEDPATIKQITDHLGQVAPKFKRAFIVVNKTTQDKYKAFMSANPNCKTKLVFHGSKNENFWSILKTGLLLNPKASVTGKMLGNGIYGALKAIKSINYTSLRGSYWSNGTSNVGYLAIFAFAVDDHNRYDVTTWSEIDTCYGLTWDKLQKIKPGATYVYAHKGSYLKEDEICIYKEDQCTIRYLVELQI